MRLNAILAVLTVSIFGLAGCATGPMYPDTPEGWAAYRAHEAQVDQVLQQSDQFLNNQTAALQQTYTQTPQVQPVGQQTTTVTAYCNQLSDNTTNCRVR